MSTPEGFRGDIFTNFLRESDVYLQFVSDVDNGTIGEVTSDGAEPEVSALGDGVYHQPLEAGIARYDLLVVTKPFDSYVTVNFPSRPIETQPRTLRRAMDGIIETAYPGRRITPSVALLGEGKEEHFDLRNSWENGLYEDALQDKIENERSSLSSIVYFLDLSLPLARSFSLNRVVRPTFMYGFNLGDAYNEPTEFVTMTHMKGRTLEKGFVQELIPRHSGYLGRNLFDDAEDMTNAIREACKLHPEQNLFHFPSN